MESIFTIGYESKTIEQYLAQLKANRIGVLIDVRKNPISRKTGYDAAVIPHRYEQLQQILQMASIKRVALTCFELEPEDCHRSRVTEALKEIESTIKIRDI